MTKLFSILSLTTLAQSLSFIAPISKVSNVNNDANICKNINSYNNEKATIN